MAKLDFSKETIEYNGRDYSIKVEGEDEKGAGGLWDMAGAFADGVCNQLERELGGFLLALHNATEIIQEHTYNFVKYIVLEKLENQLNKQNRIDLEKYKVVYDGGEYSLKFAYDAIYDGDLDDFAGAFAYDICNQLYGESSDKSDNEYDVIQSRHHIIQSDTCNLLQYVVLPQLAEQLNNQIGLEKCKVVYNDKKYCLKVGEDETTDGDLDDFMGAFANSICDQIYGKTISEESRDAYSIIQSETRYLMESVVLGQLQEQLNKQKQSEM